MSRPRGIAMNASERFLKFAAECEAMAKFSHSRENKTVWRELAERWLRIADFVERQNTLANSVVVRSNIGNACIVGLISVPRPSIKVARIDFGPVSKISQPAN